MPDLKELAMDYSYDGILITDALGTVIYINERYSKITGLTKEDVLFQNLEDLCEQHLISKAISLDVIRERKVISTTHHYVSGKEALSTAAPIFHQGEFIGVINNIRDLHDLIDIQTQIDKSVFDRATEELSVYRNILNVKTDFVYRSPIMEKTILLANRVAPFDTTVAITGDSGTGKEVLARYIHQNSSRKNESFIKVNCASIPSELFESELFGYVEGAFTGAKEKGKIGLFEVADGGTLLLDEVGEIPLEMQSKLLRALQEKEIRRVGSEKPIPVDVRILSATNRDLQEEVLKGNFREDLYFRLNVFPISIPPLVKRSEDIPLLIDFTMEKLNRKYQTTKSIAPEAKEALQGYTYPGNVRELENIIEYMFIMSTDKITLETIPGKILTNVMMNTNDKGLGSNQGLTQLVELYERTILEDIANRYTNLRDAAEVLKIHHTTLHRKLKKYNIELRKPDEHKRKKQE